MSWSRSGTRGASGRRESAHTWRARLLHLDMSLIVPSIAEKMRRAGVVPERRVAILCDNDVVVVDARLRSVLNRHVDTVEISAAAVDASRRVVPELRHEWDSVLRR